MAVAWARVVAAMVVRRSCTYLSVGAARFAFRLDVMCEKKREESRMARNGRMDLSLT